MPEIFCEQGVAKHPYIFLHKNSIIDVWQCLKYASEYVNQSAFTCSKLIIETLNQGVKLKYVQS